jgi:hypothetical protein
MAGPPLPHFDLVGSQGAPVPATVLTTPSAVIRRIRLSLRSTTSKLPSGRAATPWVSLNRAEVARPPSPQGLLGAGQGAPVPAIVMMMPSALTSLMRFSSPPTMKPPPGSRRSPGDS